MDIVTLVNRTSTVVEGTFDGQPFVLKPHEARPLLASCAEKIKEQNPVMGTDDPSDPRAAQYLVGVKEWGDDVTPIERSGKPERLDRSLLDQEANTAKEVRVAGSRGSRVSVALNDDNPTGIKTS